MTGTSFFFENTRPDALDVYVEPWPEMFRLAPGEVLEIRYVATGTAEIRIVAHGEGITLWADLGHQPDFLIDGREASNRSWDV